MRFGTDLVRPTGRTSGGMRGIRLAPGDRLAGMDVVDPKGELLIVTQLGHGKRTRVSEFQPHGRGNAGVKTLTITKKTGSVYTVRSAHGAEELMLISGSGIVIRTPLHMISRQGRAAQGVTVMNLKPGDKVAAVALLNGDNEGDLDADELTAASAQESAPKARAGSRGRVAQPKTASRAPAAGVMAAKPAAKARKPGAKIEQLAAKAAQPSTKAVKPAAKMQKPTPKAKGPVKNEQ